MTDDIDIRSLIPHRRRMLLVNRLEEAATEPASAITSSTVEARWPLADGESVDPVVMIEVIAQSAAALAGWQRREAGAAERGLLVGIKTSRWEPTRVPIGARLETRVTTLWDREEYALFRGEVRSGGALVAQAEIQVYRGK